MSIQATCACGATYQLKDEYAGRLVACPKCGQSCRAGVPPGIPAGATGGDPVFARDQFLLRQKHLSVSEKYYVGDEQGQSILFVERPAHLLRNLAAIMGGILAGLVLGTILSVLSQILPTEEARNLGLVAAWVAGLAALAAVAVALSRKRDVHFYRDDTRRELVLQVFQDQKIALIHATYTIADAGGQVLGRLDKNHLYNLFRKRWNCTDATGKLVCVAREDSAILSLLRRLLGPFFGLLRTNFILFAPDEIQVLGEFNRKFTILDRYALKLTDGPGGALNRRLAVALGVMLDTGERR
jgi:uncharacterized protein YxjI